MTTKQARDVILPKSGSGIDWSGVQRALSDWKSYVIAVSGTSNHPVKPSPPTSGPECLSFHTDPLQLHEFDLGKREWILTLDHRFVSHPQTLKLAQQQN